MIDLNFDINKIIQFQLAERVNETPTVKSQPVSETSENSEDSAVKLETSKNTSGNINNLISKEDVLVQQYNTAKTIYDELSNIRLQIAGLIDSLNDTETVHTVSSLDKLDKDSNVLIEKAIRVVRENDTMGLADTNFLNSFYDGMNFLKKIELKYNQSSTKLEDFVSNVTSGQDYYSSLSDVLYDKILNVFDGYEKLPSANTSSILNTDSKSLQEQIIKNPNETLKAMASNLVPEVVLRLLQ